MHERTLAVERRGFHADLVIARAHRARRAIHRDVQVIVPRGSELKAKVQAMRAVDRIACLARDEGTQHVVAGSFATLDVDLQGQDVAPMRGARERPRDDAKRLLDHGIDLALLRVASHCRFDMQRPAEGIVRQLVLQRRMSGAQAACILRLSGAGEEDSAEQGSQHGQRLSKKRSAT